MRLYWGLPGKDRGGWREGGSDSSSVKCLMLLRVTKLIGGKGIYIPGTV